MLSVHALLAAGAAFLPPADVGEPPTTPGPGAATYTNPVISEIGPADPDVIEVHGKYYLYPTDDGRTYGVYTSNDLVHWERGPTVFAPPDAKNLWAPDVYRHPDDGKFYLYYTRSFSIGVAVADSPLGPFEDRGVLIERTGPADWRFAPGEDPRGAIDAELFRDDDGRLYLYHVRTADYDAPAPGEPFELRVWVQPMESPTKTGGEPIFLLGPTEPWERASGNVTEGPVVLKRDGTYYLLYSGTGAASLNYAVGYATSDSPTGPFVKHPGNPIVARGGGAFGPGHGCVVRDAAGALWHVYHQQKDGSRRWNRFLCLDPLWFDDDGALHGRATRGAPQPAPATTEADE